METVKTQMARENCSLQKEIEFAIIKYSYQREQVLENRENLTSELN